jgi:WD40 repeat protein
LGFGIWIRGEQRRIDGLSSSHSVALADDGRLLVAGDTGGALHVWDVRRWQEIENFTGHAGGIMCVAVSPDSRYALTGGIDHTVRLWRLPAPDLQD